MLVRVDNMRTQLNLLNKTLVNYEEDYRNFYNELNNASSYWQDPHAEKFFNNAKLEELKAKNTIEEITSLRDVYTYFVEKYENLGNRISFDLDKKEDCLLKLEKTLNQMEEIVRSYEQLNTSFCPSIGKKLNDEKQVVIKEIKNLQAIKEKIKETFLAIEEIEKNIYQKLSKIGFEVVKEANLREFIGG